MIKTKSASGLCVPSENQFPLCFLRILFQYCSLPKRPWGLLLPKKINYILLAFILFYLCLLILDNNPTPTTGLLNQNLGKNPKTIKFNIVLLYFSSCGKFPFYLSVETFCCTFQCPVFCFFQNLKLSLQKLSPATDVPPIQQKYFKNSN